MIHDNNYAAGRTSARDPGNVHDVGKSLPAFITDKTRRAADPRTDERASISVCVGGARTFDQLTRD